MGITDYDPNNPVQLNLAGQKKNHFELNQYGSYGINKPKKPEANPYAFFTEPSGFDESLINVEALKKATSSLAETTTKAADTIKEGVGAGYESKDTSLLESGVGTEDVEADLAGGGIAALGEVPGMIATWSDHARSKKEATAKTLSTAISGAKIGGAIVPGWGHAIGGAVGLIAGKIGNNGWKKKFRAEEDKEFMIAQAQKKKEEIENYYNSNNSSQMKAQYDLMQRIYGYEPT